MRLLSMLAGLPLPEGCRATLDGALSLMTKLVVSLVLLRAARLTRLHTRIRNPKQVARAEARHDVRQKEPAGSMRSTIGSLLRRAVRANGAARKDVRARAEKLLRVLNALDVWAARLARRTRNGMTRLSELQNGVALALPLCCALALRADAGLSTASGGASCAGAFDAAAPP